MTLQETRTTQPKAPLDTAVARVGAEARTGHAHSPKLPPTSTVNRGKSVTLDTMPKSNHVQVGTAALFFGDSLDLYPTWEQPDTIVSDGGYGILGFEGDTANHMGLDSWYEPHVEAWARHAKFGTTLWFWNSEIGWAAVHPVLERCGWRYVNANTWDKGKGHIAASTDVGDVVWEPFGGMFTASVAAAGLGRRSFAAEIDSTYFQYGVCRVRSNLAQSSLPMSK